MNGAMIPLSKKDTFRFTCSPAVRCFNECCRDLNQLLTPYDILRLKSRLGMTSGQFLSTYAVEHDGPQTGLPVVSLKPDHSSRLKCPFVRKEGCTVYQDRPTSCRIYPLARMVKKSRETGQVEAFYALMKEPHCQGHKAGKSRTIESWIKDQALSDFFEMNDRFLDIIGLKNQLLPGPLDLKHRYLFRMAMYDVDHFRNQIFERDLLGSQLPDKATLKQIKENDSALLIYGHAWIQRILFNPTKQMD